MGPSPRVSSAILWPCCSTPITCQSISKNLGAALMDRREFLQLLGVASAAGLALPLSAARPNRRQRRSMTRLLSVMFLFCTSPTVTRNCGRSISASPMSILASAAWRTAPRILSARLSQTFRRRAGYAARSRLHLLDFGRYAPRLRQDGRLRSSGDSGEAPARHRPGALLLDGGDTWQGSASALWTQGQDMVEAARSCSASTS